MGIPKYHRWLTERYPDAFTEAQHESADHVYVDINSQLHDCMRHATSKDNFFQQLFSKLDSLFRTVAPSKSVFLAVDGPASCAKCLTQRQRRRAHAQKDAKNSKGSKGKGKGKWSKGGKNGQESKLSNNMLTPGVPFMTELTSALEYYAVSRMAPGGIFARCEAVTVSGAHAIGEGEHKIVSQMLRQAASAAGAGRRPESHVIFSGDADIFLLSLVQSACRRVRVVSERPQEGGKKRGRGPMLQIWNAEILARYIQAELTRGPGAAPRSSDQAAVRRDFALISLLAGNDYLPELRCGVTPQKIWEQYLSLRRKKFPHNPLIEACQVEGGLPASHAEGGWALTVGEEGSAFASEPYEHYGFHQPLLLELMKAASGGAVGTGAVSDREAEGSEKYLQGLLWIMEMYHHGYCGDFYFTLEKSLHCFASASVIARLLLNLQETGAEPIVPPRSEQPPMRPLCCAICILPSQQAEQFLCPSAPALQPMFATDHPLLGSVNAMEQSAALHDLKAKVAQFQQEMMRLRNQGSDDSQAKSMLTMYSQQMEAMKRGGTDIDVVPLWDVDAEVAERCDGLPLPGLDFAPDMTMLRGAGSKPFTLAAPAHGMGPARCSGLLRVSGEWPKAEGAVAANGAAYEEPLEEEVEEVEEDCFVEESSSAGVEEQGWEWDEDEDEFAEAPAVGRSGQGKAEAAGGSCSVSVGDEVEAYWPDDDTWISASIAGALDDGSWLITWAEDGSQSEVPADYVRSISTGEPPVKRSRLAAR